MEITEKQAKEQIKALRYIKSALFDEDYKALEALDATAFESALNRTIELLEGALSYEMEL